MLQAAANRGRAFTTIPCGRVHGSLAQRARGASRPSTRSRTLEEKGLLLRYVELTRSDSADFGGFQLLPFAVVDTRSS